MNESGKITLAAGIGLLIGAAAGGAGVYFYSKRYFQEKADNDIKEMADYYSNKYADDILKKKEDRENDKQVEEESNEKEQTEYKEKASIYETREAEETDKVNYSGCFGDSNTGDIPVSAPVKKKGGRKKKTTDIEVVDDDTWNENPAGFDTKFMEFYDADSVLVDEDTELPVDDDILEKFVNDNSSKAVDDSLIIQDNRNKVLIHVTVEQMAYSEVGADD